MNVSLPLFLGHLISRYGDIEWPARSHDLSVCDFQNDVLCFFNVLCYVSRPLTHFFLQMLKYVLPYKCNCIMISNTFNFFNS